MPPHRSRAWCCLIAFRSPVTGSVGPHHHPSQTTSAEPLAVGMANRAHLCGMPGSDMQGCRVLMEEGPTGSLLCLLSRLTLLGRPRSCRQCGAECSPPESQECTEVSPWTCGNKPGEEGGPLLGVHSPLPKDMEDVFGLC